MLMWIFFWWLLGVLILLAATWRCWSIRGWVRVTAGELISVVVFPLIWPILIMFIAIEDDWLDVPVFDLDWFRKGKKDE